MRIAPLAIALTAAPFMHGLVAAEEGTGVSIHADLLFVQMTGLDTDYAIPDADDDGDLDGSISRVEPGFEPGFRFGASYANASNVIFGLDLTVLSTEEDDTTTDPNIELSASQLHSDDNLDLSDFDIGIAIGEVEADFFAIDIFTGYMLKPSETFEVAITGGISFLDFEQTGTFTYGDDDGGLDSSSDIVRSNKAQEFTGYGISVGADAAMRIAGGFRATGALGLGVLFGTSELSFSEDNVDDNEFGVTDISYEEDRVIPHMSLALGVEYDWAISGPHHLVVGLAYELSVYSGLAQDLRFPDDVNDAALNVQDHNLGTQGLSLNLGYEF